MTGGVAVLFWVVVAAVLFVVEGATTQLVGIWFAVGALVAVLPSLLGFGFTSQLVFFLVASLLFLFLIRPVVKEKIAVKRQPTNADMVVGQTGIVLEDIDNIRQTGRVQAMGLTWTARSEGGAAIPKDAEVLVKRIEGVKLIVTPLKEQAPVLHTQHEGGTH